MAATVSLGGKWWIHSIWFDSNFCRGQQSWLQFKAPIITANTHTDDAPKEAAAAQSLDAGETAG